MQCLFKASYRAVVRDCTSTAKSVPLILPTIKPSPSTSLVKNVNSRDIRCRVKEGETEEQARERRIRESMAVEARVVQLYGVSDFESEMSHVGDNLCLIEVVKEGVCQTGLDEEPELQWKEDKARALRPCQDVKNVLQRIARECDDVGFYQLQVDSPESVALADKLGVDTFPSLVFYKNGQRLWINRGVNSFEQNMSEGLLWYGDQAARGELASTFVKDVKSKAELQDFVSTQAPHVLTVVDVSLHGCEPCMHIYPAVLALAKNFVGFASFARLLGDENDETESMLHELKIVEVPTFIFYRGGVEVGRHTGSSRGDLIGQILQQQAAQGIAPPPPPKKAPMVRQPMKRRV